VIILTDCDGVLLDWEATFKKWMAARGYELRNSVSYDVADWYGIEKGESRRLIKTFNESAAIGYLKPLRDSVKYVRKLHKEYGYSFRVITSLSEDKWAGKARRKNLKKYFGDAIESVICLPCGADKDEALAPYKDSGMFFIEDKPENAEVGKALGLRSILVEHEHNKDYESLKIVKTWKEIYDYVRTDEVEVLGPFVSTLGAMRL
jgi:FMN phosphatase YigB (HAD superfamily)